MDEEELEAFLREAHTDSAGCVVLVVLATALILVTLVVLSLFPARS